MQWSNNVKEFSKYLRQRRKSCRKSPMHYNTTNSIIIYRLRSKQRSTKDNASADSLKELIKGCKVFYLLS